MIELSSNLFITSLLTTPNTHSMHIWIVLPLLREIGSFSLLLAVAVYAQ